jgi:hypothetical protein
MSESTPEAPPPPPPPAPSRLPFVFRILGGIVVVAIVVGIGLVAERLTDDDLVLPDEVGGLAADDSAESREFEESNSSILSEAYDDAEAVTGRYGLESEVPLLVTAVRAESSPPVSAWFDVQHEWVVDGDVACAVTEKRRTSTALCQRTRGELTVRVFATGQLDVDEIVDATNEVWEELS